MISEWYVAYYKKSSDMNDLTYKQITLYEDTALSKGLAWTQK